MELSAHPRISWLERAGRDYVAPEADIGLEELENTLFDSNQTRAVLTSETSAAYSNHLRPLSAFLRHMKRIVLTEEIYMCRHTVQTVNVILYTNKEEL